MLSVLRASTYEAAVELVNSSPYGNGVAVFTNDGGAARRFVSEAEIGMVGVNVPIPVPMRRITRSVAGRLRCSVTRTCTAPRACTSIPAGRR